jgi:hypothetical protein
VVFGGFVSVLFALPIGNKNSLYDKGKLDDIVKAYSLSGGVMSFLLYLLSNSSDASKFFFLPYRYWEFAFGAYVAAFGDSMWKYKTQFLYISVLLICFLLCFNSNITSNAYRLILTTFVTIVVISNLSVGNSSRYLKLSFVTLLGRASLSIYLWHQFIFAFYRYAFNAKFDTISYCSVLVISLIIGLCSYRFIEQDFSHYIMASKTRTWLVLGLNCLVALVLISASLRFYRHNGIVRNVPELSISLNNTSFQSQDYNSRNNAFDTDFQCNGKNNILVLGDSFARNWISVLRESGALHSYNISVHSLDDSVALARAKQADLIFIANNGPFAFHRTMPEIAKHKYYRIGHKNFGLCNGNVYDGIILRCAGYNQTFLYNDSLNVAEHKLFGNNFIDIMGSIRLPNGRYPYFTPDHKFFSHDCIHLTQAGAQRLAILLNIKKLLADNIVAK